MMLVAIAILLANLNGCSNVPERVTASTDSAFASATRIGYLEGADLREASGIVASILHEGMWWVINDSGYEPLVYLVDSTGNARAHYRLAGVNNRDWEDIAIRHNPISGKSELMVAEIGDNAARYDVKYVYIMDEPEANRNDLNAPPPARSVRAYAFVYPDGNRDAETLMVDPADHAWYVVSKREEQVRLYQFNPEYVARMDSLYLESEGSSSSINPGMIDTLRYHISMPFSGAVAGDISADGTEVLIKNYDRVFYWERGDGTTSIPDLLATDPRPQPYIPETQGESIAFKRKPNAGYVTVSEKAYSSDQPFLYYPRLRR